MMLTIHTSQGLRRVAVESGICLSAALSHAHCAPEMPCGGKGRCGKCRVRVSGALSEVSEQERAALGTAALDAGMRLACCTELLGDAEVWPEENRAVSQICTDVSDVTLGSDPVYRTLGAAVDIGTTTLAVQLYSRAGLLATAGAPNPQREFGADVISRVGYAMQGGAAALSESVRGAIASLLRQACQAAGTEPSQIDALVITGNTAMLHLLTGDDPSPLAAAPFVVRERYGKTIPAASLDLHCAADAIVYLPRCMSAFVGADITTALLASGICTRDTTALLTDIGTNGEIALWQNNRLLCCSTAAGPAFEGANLQYGMQGAPGAIDHATVENGQMRLHTIGDQPAVGICGSGVADVLACLLELDVLDETGYLDADEDYWPLAGGVVLTQKDVRQVQLAKSAVRAGMEALLHHTQLAANDVTELAVAGGFGSYLRLESAAAIGLIPPALASRCRVLGNAALAGAAMLLHDATLLKTSTAMADSAETVELSTDPFFMDQYVQQMMF